MTGTLREQAEFFRLALLMGLAEVPAVIAWADALIVSSAEVPPQLIDVSLAAAGPADEVAALLGRLPGEGDPARAAHRVLGTLLARLYAGELSGPEAAELLGAYGFHAAAPEAERQEAGNFPEYLYCWREGHWGTEEQLRRDVEEFLTSHAEV
jgi:hypothetical protein